ncbi:MAG TPA: uridine kinase [Micromonosporaceae bacterium]
MQVRPISRSALIDELAERLISETGRIRVAIDGAEALDPGALAEDVADALRNRGRYVIHVRTDDFLLPASQRFEFGRMSPESFYDGWWDERGLQREVLDPAVTTGRVLPALWRADIDRSARADYVTLPETAVLFLSGQFLLGGGLPFETVVRLTASGKALERRTPPDRAWTLPAYERYDEEVAPDSFADIVVRLEDPRHPAVIEA